MTTHDKIYALSSGVGRSAVAVMRISGKRTGLLLQSMIGELPPPRQLSLRNIVDVTTNDVIDRGMVAWLPGPRSFTGEDCAELHLHGSPAVLASVMQLLSQFPGVRPAEAGEFTRRAFFNDKMDMVEVEGLADLLEARTAGQRRQAFRQMSGRASTVFETWRERLLHIRASIEAAVDFADEAGVAEAAFPSIDRGIRELRDDLQRAITRSRSSEIVRDGLRVVIAGHPNTGKSSLLNALARREAAIVSDVPGTTRDPIEVTLDIGGMAVMFTDTAGLRQVVSTPVEEEGIKRSRERILGADIVLWVWSADIIGSELPEGSLSPDLFVQNKSDLIAPQSRLSRNVLTGGVELSTKTERGLPELLTELSILVENRYGDVESVVFTSARQKIVAQRSIRHLNDALEVDNSRLEMKAEEVRCACEEIARLTGRVDVEDWLGAIFSRFCIGK
jgi:tRNA modification GTPase